MQSPTPKLLLAVHDHTALITINNPPANTWDEESLDGLTDLVAQASAERTIYSLVITGQGQKFFSAGADLNRFAEGGKVAAKDMSERFGTAFEALSNFSGVSIAAINGYAMGGGLECALACDIRIVEEHAQLALPEASVGLLPCGGGTQNLAWLVGEGWAKRMILCGERVDSSTALRIGLAEEIVSPGQVRDKALALAAAVEGQSPPAVTACKELIQSARSGHIDHAYTLERSAFVNLFDTQDQAEGVNAFLEKRKPQWVNG
ncbi:MAG: enoyl-CoA hydratase [Pseudomonadota bacterium]